MYSSAVFRAVLLCALAATRVVAQSPLTFGQTELHFAAPAGSTTPIVQTVRLDLIGQSLPFNVSLQHIGTTVPWLSVAPRTGTTPAILTLTANPKDLAPGRYLAQLTAAAGLYGAYLNVWMTVGSGGGALAVNPSGLTFVGATAGGSPQPQTIQVTSRKSGNVPMEFTASASGRFLTVNPFPMRTPAPVSVVVSTLGLAPGIHSGSVTLTPVDGSEPTVVPVALAVTGVANPLRVGQTALTFNHQAGASAPPFQYLDVLTPGTSFRPYTVISNVPWLRVSTVFLPQPAASVSGITPAQVIVSVDPGSLPAGTFTGKLTVSSAEFGTVEVPVTLHVGLAPALNANPSSIGLDDFLGFETFTTVTSTGSSTLQFSAVVSPAVPWLTVTPSSGSTQSGAQTLTITANPAALSEGTHTTTINLVHSGGASLAIPVRVIATGAGAVPMLVVPEEAVSLAGISGVANPFQSVFIHATPPGATLPFTAAATSNGGWLRVDPFSATAPARVTITADTSALAEAGDYEGAVVVTSLTTGDKYSIPVNFRLARPAMAANPASLTFTQTQPRVAPPPQTLQLTANVPSTFTVRTTANWVRVDTLSGATPATIRISVDPTGLSPGNNTATVQIIGPNNQVNVPVTLTVPDPPGPTATPDSLTFVYDLGSPTPSPRTIAVSSSDDPIDFTAAVATATGGNWLSVSPRSGRTPANLAISIDTTRLVIGQHSGTITLTTTDKLAPARVVNVRLTVNPATVVVQDILHSATFSPTPVAPGQIVSIVGTGMGPVTGAGARPTAGGVIESRLGEIRVLFDATPAPLLFVRNDQINAIVPYSVYGRANTRVQVEWGNSLSLPIDVRVVDAAPGLFTTGTLGRGQAAALNTDLTANSATNPAAPASIITVFGTGEGQTDPPGQDGRVIASDVRRPLLLPTATIDGRPAEITYMGSAPSLVSGVFQANIRLPEETASGNVAVQLTIGGVATQSGVTIAVR